MIEDGDVTSLRAKVISQAIASENMRSSAVFEDREVRARSNSLRLLNAALINVIAVAQPLGAQLDTARRNGDRGEAAIDDARAEATAAITAWRSGTILAAELHAALLKAAARPPPSGLRAFFAALVAYAEAYDECFAADPKQPRGRIGFGRSNDMLGALWTGLRAAVAVSVASSFWILSAWPAHHRWTSGPIPFRYRHQFAISSMRRRNGCTLGVVQHVAIDHLPAESLKFHDLTRRAIPIVTFSLRSPVKRAANSPQRYDRAPTFPDVHHVSPVGGRRVVRPGPGCGSD